MNTCQHLRRSTFTTSLAKTAKVSGKRIDGGARASQNIVATACRADIPVMHHAALNLANAEKTLFTQRARSRSSVSVVTGALNTYDYCQTPAMVIYGAAVNDLLLSLGDRLDPHDKGLARKRNALQAEGRQARC